MEGKRALLIFCAVLCSFLYQANGQAGANISLSFVQISTDFNSPIGIDYHEPTNSIVMSSNYPSGSPINFVRINFDGTQSQFSNSANQGEEIKIATVRSGNPAGFVAGDLFTGNGNIGQIMRVTNNGNRVINPWCTFPGSNQGLMRGSMYVDRTGVFGGRLIVVTTTGKVWTVGYGDTQCVNPVQLADCQIHLEGVMTVPNNPSRYGAMAGKIIAGAEGPGYLYAIDLNGNIQYWSVPVKIEDLDMIEPDENFFGVNFGTGRLLGAPASQFAPLVGSILAAQEVASLWELYWDFGLNRPNAVQIQTSPSSPAQPGQWEHVTFAPAGIKEILPSNFSLCMLANINGNQVINNIYTIPMAGTDTAVANYNWNINSAYSATPAVPPLESNTLTMFFTQDIQNTFTLTIIADNKDSTGGSLGLQVQTTGLGNPNLMVQDDPTYIPGNSGDTADSYFWSNGNGAFSWTWGPGRTDGTVIGPLSLVTATAPFTIRISLTSFTGISTWKFITRRTVGGAYESFNVPVTQGSTLTLKRVSCDCGNGVVDPPLEECDGGPCCDSECHLIPAGTVCRAVNGACDLTDTCDGVSPNCVNNFLPNTITCRASAGVCDPAERCTGVGPNCPTDVMSPNTVVCRPAAYECDAPERCTGSSPACPQDVPVPNNPQVQCDDRSNCTTNSFCVDGICTGVDRLCQGVCGDGILAAGEECDDGNNLPNDCCSPSCVFEPSTTVCRASTARCDPPEFCTGNSYPCPIDDNTTCPVCPQNCSNHGLCLQGGTCQCDPGYVGATCNNATCEIYSDCGSCATNEYCGWCCARGECVLGTPTTTNLCSLGSYAYHNCTCPVCVFGNCECGRCKCQPGYGGPGCDIAIDCSGQLLLPGVTPKLLDVCSVCGGNGTTCIGCDGIPNSGKVYDKCGVCGGDDQSCYTRCFFDNCGDCVRYGEGVCAWCLTTDSCFDQTLSGASCAQVANLPETCPSFWDNQLQAGLTIGAIVGIALGAGAAVAFFVFGGKKGYDYFKKYRGMTGTVHNSPLYQDHGAKGTNPLYEEPAIEMKDK